MMYVHNDGGRAAAGFTGKTSDCAVRAIAIATESDYREVYGEINLIGLREPQRKRKGRAAHRSDSRLGVWRDTMDRYFASIGWEWVPTMEFGKGCSVHLREDELPTGRIVVRLSRHYAAVIDGVLHDNHDSSRDGTRCVYGYWRKAR